MLWNWTTIDACFLSKSWHVRTMGQFAGSVVGVFFLCMAIEAIRRAAREYDRRITLGARIEATAKGSKRVEVTWVQQAIVSGVGGLVASATGSFSQTLSSAPLPLEFPANGQMTDVPSPAVLHVRFTVYGFIPRVSF